MPNEEGRRRKDEGRKGRKKEKEGCGMTAGARLPRNLPLPLDFDDRLQQALDASDFVRPGGRLAYLIAHSS
eukprot:gene16046-biopygen7979